MPKDRVNGTSYLDGLSLDDLQDLYNQYKGDTSDEGARTFGQIRSKLLRMSHQEIHRMRDDGFADTVYPMNVPYAHDGAPFTINGVPISGPQEICGCQLQVIMEMIWHNRQVEAERMREGGKIIDMGDIAGRAAEIQRN